MLKTSLFNKGIYKSQLSRFKWGSVLYFILLFFTTSFILIINDYSHVPDYSLERFAKAGGLILSEDYIIFPMLFASVVPTVTAFLAFDMFSSKKQSVFIHSLPCGRTSIYISTILGALTLMAVPVILNGIILSLISIFKLGELFTVFSCIKWVGINLIILFIMFSVATFSAGLTSNRISMLFINALLHILPLIIAFSMGSIASIYLYGFDENFNYLIDKIIRWMPITFGWVYSGDGYGRFAENVLSLKGVIFCVGSALFYVIGLILYKLRNNETAGNFVAFKVMNPIFKYTVTTIGFVVTFSALHLGGLDRNFYMVFLLVVVSLVIYFATEMILKKNLKVLYAYKGYLAFLVICLIVNLFIQHTSFFGYEKRLPKEEDIESVAVFETYRYDKPYCSDADVIKLSLDYHNDIISEIPSTIKQTADNSNFLVFEYKLKNGKTFTRSYRDLYLNEYENIMTGLYENEAYKFARDSIHKLETDYFNFMRVSFWCSDNYSLDFGIEGKKNIENFLTAWKADIKELGFKEKSESNIMHINLDYKLNTSGKNDDYKYVHDGFNHNYKNVIKFLETEGYLDKVYRLDEANMYISKNTNKIETVPENEHLAIQYFNGRSNDLYSLKKEEVVKVEANEKTLVVQDVLEGNLKKDFSDGEKYIIYVVRGTDEIFERYTMFLSIDKNSLPEYLLKYVNN